MKVKTAYVEITNQCNLNCRTCYNRSGKNRVREEISREKLEELLQLLLPLGLERFLFSGGEPTCHTAFDDILDFVSVYPQVSFGIATNGTHPTPKLIELLNTRDNFTLQISLDGSCEEQNSKTRGPGHFAQAIAFSRQIHQPTKKPLLQMVVSQQNVADVEDFYRLAVSVGFVPEFAFIYRSGNGEYAWDDKALTAQQKLSVLRLVDRLNRECQMEAFLPLCTTSCPFAESRFDELSLCIKVDGSIQPCQMLYDSRFTLGNAFAFDLMGFTSKLNELATIAHRRKNTDYGCSVCLLREGCGKGCMASAVNLHGDPLADDGDCAFRKLQFLGFDLKGALAGKS